MEIRCMMERRAEPERHDAACRYVMESEFYRRGKRKYDDIIMEAKLIFYKKGVQVGDGHRARLSILFGKPAFMSTTFANQGICGKS